MHRLTKTAILLIAVFLLSPSFYLSANEKMCSYSTYRWNVSAKKSVMRQRVKHLYSKVTSVERDELTGCTVCEEDQRALTIGHLKTFKVCRLVADKLKFHLSRLIEQGEPINKIVGYRVGMTRGKVDRRGNRTQFSNHSFGIAIDINDEQNGLYENCINFNESCRLIRGGRWSYDNQASLKINGKIVKSLNQIGFKWGGEIKGKQKDFMHFSPSGY